MSTDENGTSSSDSAEQTFIPNDGSSPVDMIGAAIAKVQEDPSAAFELAQNVVSKVASNRLTGPALVVGGLASLLGGAYISYQNSVSKPSTDLSE